MVSAQSLSFGKLESREIGLPGLVKQDNSFTLLSRVSTTQREQWIHFFFPVGIFFGGKLNAESWVFTTDRTVIWQQKDRTDAKSHYILLQSLLQKEVVCLRVCSKNILLRVYCIYHEASDNVVLLSWWFYAIIS